jgi:hypothetical protein
VLIFDRDDGGCQSRWRRQPSARPMTSDEDRPNAGFCIAYPGQALQDARAERKKSEGH